MARLSNLKRKSSVFKRKEEANWPTSTFDLSHAWKASFKLGQLIPFVTLETLPGDRFSFGGAEIMVRFAPLIWPIMHRLTMTTNYFYVPNRILWEGEKNWEKFISGKLPEVGWPYLQVLNDDLGNANAGNFLCEYMGVPSNLNGVSGDVATQRINVLPMAAYWKIYDEYYSREQVQEARFKNVEEGQTDQALGNNLNYGLTSINGNGLPATVNWNLDYFTAGFGRPQGGDQDVLIPMVGSNENDKLPYRLKNYNTDGEISVGNLEHGAHAGGERGFVVGGVSAGLDIQESAASIREFRVANALQVYLERLQRSSQRYSDYLKGMFGSNPSPGTIEDPIWIGGSVSPISISEVMQTATTNTDPNGAGQPEETITPTGAYAGQALGLDNANGFGYSASEHGFVLGLISISPRSSYHQGLGRMWTRENYLDYPLPDFANIGDQAVLTKELYMDWRAVATTNNSTFSYVPRYSEMRYCNDVVAGQFRNDFLSYHMGRVFDVNAIPTLSSEFLLCKPRTEMFATLKDQEDMIYAHVWNEISVKRILPKYGIPRL